MSAVDLDTFTADIYVFAMESHTGKAEVDLDQGAQVDSQTKRNVDECMN